MSDPNNYVRTYDNQEDDGSLKILINKQTLGESTSSKMLDFDKRPTNTIF